MEGFHTLLSFVVIAAIFCLVPQGANGDCDLESAKKGSELCHKAFEETFDKNKKKVIEHPKKTGCCLSFNMGDCVQHAFSSAHCNPEDQDITKLVERVQSHINKGATYVGSFICGQQSRAMCSHLVDEYDEAKEEITEMNEPPTTTTTTEVPNTTSSLVTSFLAMACLLLPLILS